MNQLDPTWPPSPEAKPPKKKKGTTYRRFCDCSRPTVRVYHSAWVCQVCYDYDSKRADRHKPCHGELSGDNLGSWGMVYTPVYTKGTDKWDPDDTTSELNYL